MARHARITDEIPIAELEIVERFDDGSSITTTGRGRITSPPRDLDDPPHHEIAWFRDDDGQYYRIDYQRGRS